MLYQRENTGVGGAILRGMAYAREAGADILVKIDGDGQMAPELMEQFVAPIVAGQADYTKGNRFYTYHFVKQMPLVRFLGNGVLSFLTKLSSGYWNVFDPTNGYIAISGAIFDELPLHRIHPRYFFETDMLYHLGLLRAVIRDIPMQAIYRDEVSGLSPIRHVLPFLWHNITRLLCRIIHIYFVRDFSIVSLSLATGIPLLIFGMWELTAASAAGLTANAGGDMLAALPLIIGFVLILNFLLIDIRTLPKEPLHPGLRKSPCRHSSRREKTQS